MKFYHLSNQFLSDVLDFNDLIVKILRIDSWTDKITKFSFISTEKKCYVVRIS
jgi:hypothetical protein